MRRLVLVLFSTVAAAGATPALAFEFRPPARPLLTLHRISPVLPTGLNGDTRPGLTPIPAEGRNWSGETGFRRVRIAYERENFYTGERGGKLGLGQAFAFNQDVIGAKMAFLGAEHGLLPQIAVGLQYRRTDANPNVFAVLGSPKRKDYYASATKLLLDRRLMLSGAVRLTKTNQAGLYGLTPVRNGRRKQYEASVAFMPTERLAIGMEYRTRPDYQGFTKQHDWTDLFIAYAFSRRLSVNAAWVDLGTVQRRRDQHGAYLSLQAGF
jgi:hypothetical protein